MSRRLAVLAGAGGLVPHLLEAAQAAGDTIEVISLASTLAYLPPGDYRNVGLDRPELALAALQQFGPTHLVLAGALSISDAQRVALMRVLGESEAADTDHPVGDVTITNLGATLAERVGARLVGAHEIAADLLAQSGQIAGPNLDAKTLASARGALDIARAIGQLDLGQSVITVGDRFVAAEDIAGTDALIGRVASYRAQGITGDTGAALILAKASKPHQSLLVDMPAIGSKTVENCASAGISVIAVEAARSLVVDRDEVERLAQASQISVIGLAADG